MTKLIITNGFPASGKTTLVTQLSKDLNLPSFSKDDFKELLADTIWFTDHESTRPFGKTSFSASWWGGWRTGDCKVAPTKKLSVTETYSPQ